MTDNKEMNEKAQAKEENKIQEPAAQKIKKEESKNKIPEIKKKSEAVACGLGMHISKKHAMYICSFIKNKPIDQAMKELQEVISFKRVIPFKGEIPHRKQLHIMSGRYPVNASKQFIYLLKSLKGNVIVNGLDIDKTRIYFGCSNWANRPAKGGGKRFKRTNVTLKAKEFEIKEAKK